MGRVGVGVDREQRAVAGGGRSPRTAEDLTVARAGRVVWLPSAMTRDATALVQCARCGGRGWYPASMARREPYCLTCESEGFVEVFVGSRWIQVRPSEVPLTCSHDSVPFLGAPGVVCTVIATTPDWVTLEAAGRDRPGELRVEELVRIMEPDRPRITVGIGGT